MSTRNSPEVEAALSLLGAQIVCNNHSIDHTTVQCSLEMQSALVTLSGLVNSGDLLAADLLIAALVAVSVEHAKVNKLKEAASTRGFLDVNIVIAVESMLLGYAHVSGTEEARSSRVVADEILTAVQIYMSGGNLATPKPCTHFAVGKNPRAFIMREVEQMRARELRAKRYREDDDDAADSVKKVPMEDVDDRF
jgi:hypothetical protein